MKRNTFLIWILWCICLLSSASNFQEYARFNHFSTKDGLPTNNINSITQDSSGFLWIASDFGLTRFDGVSFKKIQKRDSLRRDDIQYVRHIGNNHIAICGYDGLFLEYDPEKDDFIDRMPAEFDSLGYSHVKGVYLCEDGRKYTYTNDGIFLYQKQTDSYTSKFKAFNALKKGVIEDIFIDSRNRFWVGSINDFYIIDAEGEIVRWFDKKYSNCGFITTIMPIGNGVIAVSSLSNELWFFDTNQEKIEGFDRVNLPFKNVSRMIKAKDGRVWFATDGDGLWYTDDDLPNAQNFKQLIPFGSEPDETKKIYALTEGENGEIWIGTQNSGIWSYQPHEKNSVTFSAEKGMPTTVCSSFSEYDNGDIVVGTDGKGFFSLSTDFKRIEQHTLPNNNITGLSQKDGKVYISTWGAGIFQLNTQNNEIQHLDFNGIDTPNQFFFGVNASSDGSLWGCSANDDLYTKQGNAPWKKMELKDDFSSNAPNKWIHRVVEGTNNTHWIITTNNLWRMDPKGLKAMGPDAKSSRSHFPIAAADACCDDEGNLFAATNIGIIRYQADGSKSDTLHFLPQANYLIICKDKRGDFWCASSKGIIQFNYKQKSYKYLPGNYTDVSTSIFIARAGFCDSKGNIYFGTNGGFYTFNPNEIDIDTTIKHLAFSDLFVSREKQQPGTGLLKNGNLAQQKELVLEYGQTDISIGVDIIDYARFNKVQIRYRLNNLQSDWIELNGQRYINFNYIPTGNYTLEIEAYRPNIEGGKKSITLPIIVLSPWWETWWFHLLCITLIIAGFLLLLKRRFNRLKREKLTLQAKVEERTAELKKALFDKDKLISIIAHDLKNPMFAIVGALENWMHKESEMSEEKKKKLISDTCRSAQTLQREMLKLLDWALSKRDEIICHPSEIDMKFIVGNVMLLLQGVINDKRINISQNIEFDHYGFADSRMAGTIVRNLLSNAIKFTPKNGEISVKGWEEANCIKLQIIDSGIGMSEEQIHRLQSTDKIESTLGTENEKGTGLGFRICQDYITRNNGSLSIASTLGKGTTVTITLPLSTKEIETANREETPLKVEINRSLLEGNTILAVDDDPLICNNIQLILEDYFQVITAHNGKEAMELAEKHLPDIVLSDVEMPEMNGIELSKRLNENKQTKHIPILFLSAKKEDNDRLIGLSSGAIDYMAKPFNPSELLLKLSNILMVRQKQQQKILSETIGKKSEKDNEAIQATNNQINPFLKSFLETLERNYQNNELSIEDLARDLAVSQSTLNRKLRSITEKTPLELLSEFRLNRALQILKENYPDKNIADVAYEVGFNDASYFTKKFREFFGFPPSGVKG